ncbi:MAG TPA: DEAD/DEAH box helicase family protein, partial [Myxococcota bacterium]
MGGAMILERASMVRARIAARLLERVVTARTLGSISLHAHQCAAVDRLRELLRDERGALLADDAGLGKTYVAAAIMREAAQPLLVIPASLRIMWVQALRAAGARATLVTYSALSRGAAPAGEFDLVVLDE